MEIGVGNGSEMFVGSNVSQPSIRKFLSSYVDIVPVEESISFTLLNNQVFEARCLKRYFAYSMSITETKKYAK